jgi:hypothetical protein
MKFNEYTMHMRKSLHSFSCTSLRSDSRIEAENFL